MSEDPNLSARLRMMREQIRARGITNQRVLDAIVAIPRERFVPPAQQHEALSDRALPIECGQTISQPYIVAAMSDALRVTPEHAVLEVGTGSGYQTAVLARLAKHVYTIERLAPLQEQARRHLASLGIQNVSYHVGDGTLGWDEFAPYDRILVTAAAPQVPPKLIEQLADGGRLVIPVGPAAQQMLVAVDKQGRRLTETRQLPCCFVKLVGQEGWDESTGQTHPNG
jgi:protein-L-isoaspartate(D-aspartate) O-methyltransferase